MSGLWPQEPMPDEDARWQHLRERTAAMDPRWRFTIRDSQTAEIVAEGSPAEWLQSLQRLLRRTDEWTPEEPDFFGWLITWNKGGYESEAMVEKAHALAQEYRSGVVRLRKASDALGFKQSDVAELLGISQPAVSLWWSEKRYPSRARRPKILELCDVLERLAANGDEPS